MKICIITPLYPNLIDKTALTFVQQLAWAMADKGLDVDVICPIPLNTRIKLWSLPKCLQEISSKGNTVTVHFPKFIYFGQVWIGNFNTARIMTYFFNLVVSNVIKKMDKKPDIFYGHFFAPAGVVACRLGKKYTKPSFIAYGESSPWTIIQYGVDAIRNEIKYLNGVISVSTSNKNDLVSLGVIEKERIEVFPNGYSRERFSPKNKQESRKLFSIPEKIFVVAFVGHFITRKGIAILESVIDQTPGVYLICAGKGELKPSSKKVLYSDIVEPDKLAYFYSAADVFVLPTLNEGCCNAIIEAMACGLPIISSDLPFNDDILNEENSIKINPLNVDSIKRAIEYLRDNEGERCKLADGSLKMSLNLTIERRIDNILKYIGENNVFYDM